MVATYYGADPATPAEKAVTFTNPGWGNQSTTAIIYAHGSGDLALDMLSKPDFARLGRAIARRNRTVVAGDNAGQAWGNDNAIARIDAQVDLLVSQGAAAQVVLVGISMGAANVLAYANAHPDNVAAVAAIIPLLDLASAHSNGYSATINAAYPPAYDDGTDGPDHSPVQFAADLPVDLPVGLWTASDDPLALPATADAFVTARPQTERTNVGALGHTGAAVAAATPGVAAFVAQHLA